MRFGRILVYYQFGFFGWRYFRPAAVTIGRRCGFAAGGNWPSGEVAPRGHQPPWGKGSVRLEAPECQNESPAVAKLRGACRARDRCPAGGAVQLRTGETECQALIARTSRWRWQYLERRPVASAGPFARCCFSPRP